jgi:hypothetical protein
MEISIFFRRKNLAVVSTSIKDGMEWNAVSYLTQNWNVLKKE